MGGSRNRRDVRKWSKGWKMKPFNKYTERICTSPNSLRRNSCTSGLYVNLRIWSMSNVQLGKKTETRQTQKTPRVIKSIIYDLQHLKMFAPLAEPSTGACEAGAPRRVRAKLRRHSRCKWLSAVLLLSAKPNSREEMGQHKNLTTLDWIDMERHWILQIPSAFTLEPSGGPQVLNFKANISKESAGWNSLFFGFSVMKYVSQSSFQFCLSMLQQLVHGGICGASEVASAKNFTEDSTWRASLGRLRLQQMKSWVWHTESIHIQENTGYQVQ